MQCLMQLDEVFSLLFQCFLQLAGKCLQFVESIKYLGVHIVANRKYKCTFEEVKLKFFSVFNCIYARSKAANSEIATVELLKYYCLP